MGLFTLALMVSLALIQPLPSPVGDFDWRAVGRQNFITRVQASTNPPTGCNASWAFAAASMLGDRLAIARRGDLVATKVLLSAQMLLNCAAPPDRDACAEGSPEWAFDRALRHGVVDETCQGYRGRAQRCTPLHVCINCFGPCDAVPEYLVYNVSAYGRLRPMDVAAEIQRRGPVVCRARAEPALPSRSGDFFAVVVGWTGGQYITNPNWGSFHGNDTVAGFLRLPPEALGECWWAQPHLQGRGHVGHQTTEGVRVDRAVVRRDTPPTLGPGPAKRPAAAVGASSWAAAGGPSAGAAARPRARVSSPGAVAGASPGTPSLPSEWDWRRHVALTPMRSHHLGPPYCGACYAMATTSTYSDRLKILRATRDPRVGDVLLSAQAVVDCVHPYLGCLGGSAVQVFAYVEDAGLPDDSCSPWQSAWLHNCKAHFCLDCALVEAALGHNGTDLEEPRWSACRHVEGARLRRYRAAALGPVKGEEAMMREIYARGPIECMMSDSLPVFVDYAGGIIRDGSNTTGHNHDVELVGWGEEAGTPYWIGRNSWGTRWGEGGWFRIYRGANTLGIEQSGCAWVVPALDTTA